MSTLGESVSSSQNNLQMKEKEYQQQLKYLAEMLNESETAVAALRAQEKVSQGSRYFCGAIRGTETNQKFGARH